MLGGFGPLISAGSSLLGGLFSRNSQRKQQAQNMAFAREQFEWQKRRIQNTVADAKAAGIHPLFALGSSAGITPVSVSGGVSDGLGPAIAQAGQQLGNAFNRAKPNALQSAQLEVSKSQANANNAQAAFYNAKAQDIQNPYTSAIMSRLGQGFVFPDGQNPGNTSVAPLVVPSVTAAATGDKNGEIPPDHWKDKTGVSTLKLPFGITWKSGDTTRTQRVEDEYGEPASWPYGLWRLGVDLRNNLNQWGDRVVTFPWRRRKLKKPRRLPVTPRRYPRPSKRMINRYQ